MQLGFLDHEAEEFEDGDVLVIAWIVLAEDMESSAADAAVAHHGVLILGDELLDVLHLVGRHLVELHHETVGGLDEVLQLLAVAVHLCRNGDGSPQGLQFVGVLLADLQALAVEVGTALDDRIAYDEVSQRLPRVKRMTLGRLDTLEVRGHDLWYFMVCCCFYHAGSVFRCS